MAKLKRARSDGHYYILAGQSKGTWQLTPQGVRELERHRVPLPREGAEGIDLNRHWWRYLWDEKLVFKHGILYEQRNHLNENVDGAHSGSLFDSGLPLVLHIQHDSRLSWSLALELTETPSDTLAEARRCRATAVSLNDALSRPISLLELQKATCPVPVAPQSAPYVLQWADGAYQAHEFHAQCLTPGLKSSTQGNVFMEGGKQTWQRCLPGRSVSFWGTIYWLARTGHEPRWPGNAHPYGSVQDGWQLWRLTIHEDQPVAWEAVADWLGERHLTLTRHTRRLGLATPPLAITSDGWILISYNQPLIVACAPPERSAPGIRPHLQLAVTRVGSHSTSNDRALPATEWHSGNRDVMPGKLLFARWQHPQPGDYRIQMTGDATVDPLLIRVLTGRPTRLAMPEWLQGLECRLKAPNRCTTLTAFLPNPSAFPTAAGETLPPVPSFSESELAQLEWELKPCGLPVHMRWRPVMAHDIGPWHKCVVTSSAELTRRWREDIWPERASARRVTLILDANSFGRIECTVGLPDVVEPAGDELLTAAQRAEFVWLARCSTGASSRSRMALPNDVRYALDALVASTRTSSGDKGIVGAIALLRAQHTVPVWIIPRLRALVIPETQSRWRNTRSFIRKQSE